MDIVYFGNDWFGENKTSSHHIAERLSKTNRVLYIECPGLRSPRGSTRDIRKIFSKLKKSFSSSKNVSETLSVCTLFQIPLHRYKVVKIINKYLIRILVKRMIKAQKFSDPLLWFLVPHLYHLPESIPNKGTIYYCIDSYSSLPGVDRDAIAFMDEEMTRNSDIVFVASQPLFEKKRLTARELVLSPHGVDFAHFNKAYLKTLPVPVDIEKIGKPIIGFWGLIESWIDLDLIRTLALKRPEWNFVMIGHVAVAHNPCEGLRNVHFLGAKKFADLPAYAQVFDVAILPYKLNEQVFNCNPLKLREYLATGKPVVSTRYPEIEKYKDFVRIADGPEQFYEHIAASLEEATPLHSSRRVEKIRSESWDQRVKEIESVVKNKFF